MNSAAASFAVCMAFDAFRICLGQKPKNFAAHDVIRWMESLL